MKIARDPVTRGWAAVTTEGVTRLGLVAPVLIARALGPADFGVFAVLTATVGAVGTRADGGLAEAAVVRISSAVRELTAASLRCLLLACSRLRRPSVSVTDCDGG